MKPIRRINSPRDFTCNNNDRPSGFTNNKNSPSCSISLSNEGNKSRSTSAFQFKTVVGKVEEDKSVKEDGEIEVKEVITFEV